MKVLAGDVGGTHARLAVVEVTATTWKMLAERRYESRKFDGLAPIVEQFRANVAGDVEAASFGVAGSIENGRVQLTNLDWSIDVNGFGDEIGLSRTRVINDFDALGHALPYLGPSDRAELQRGTPRAQAPIGVIGAGTGLGEAFLLWENGHYRVHDSEGGHVDLAPQSALQWRLAEHFQTRYGHASFERVVSGPGLVDVYRFLVADGYAPERRETRTAMGNGDAAAVISERALAGDDPLCEKALSIFVEMYGAQAGNLALTIKAEGGIYVAGGIAPKILPRLRAGSFLDAFRRKGRMSNLLSTIPVWVILNPDVGLVGAAAAALPV